MKLIPLNTNFKLNEVVYFMLNNSIRSAPIQFITQEYTFNKALLKFQVYVSDIKPLVTQYEKNALELGVRLELQEDTAFKTIADLTSDLQSKYMCL